MIYGADAVYIGGEAFGLRAKAKNFSMEEMREGIRFAHDHEVKVYVTANILAHNDDLEGVRNISKSWIPLQRRKTGCTYHRRSWCVYDCKGSLPGY